MTLHATLKSLAEGATPGPWSHERRKYESVILHHFKGADGYNNRIACAVQWSPATFPQPTTDVAEANAALIVALRNALPTILAALEACEWVYPKSLDDMPAKPGKANYEYVDCLILHKGDLLFRPWNCEHLVFDDADYDDHFCEWSDVTAYLVVKRPSPPVGEG